MFGFTLMAVTLRGVCAEDKEVSELSALKVYSVCPCGSLLMLLKIKQCTITLELSPLCLQKSLHS